MVRFKNRYLLCAIATENGSEAQVYNLQSRDILNAVRASLSVNFGDFGVGQLMASLAIKLWSPALGLCLIRSSRDHFRTAWGAITFVTALSNVPQLGRVRLHVIHVGGTIKSCQESAVEHGRRLILLQRQKGSETSKLESVTVAVKREMENMDI